MSNAFHWPPCPRHGDEMALERSSMIETQIRNPEDGRRPVKSEVVLEAIQMVPRHIFVPADSRESSYADRALPIEAQQTISQPYMVALMTELLNPSPQSRILEVGTGSGYQAAVLNHLTPHVYSIEVVEELYNKGRETLSEEGYEGIHLLHGDGYLGWPQHAPFDGIIVTCAEEDIPPPLWDQLAPGGRLVIPVGAEGSPQRLVLIEKTLEGNRRSQTIIGVRFVPMVHHDL